jgi:hypothetical protein
MLGREVSELAGQVGKTGWIPVSMESLDNSFAHSQPLFIQNMSVTRKLCGELVLEFSEPYPWAWASRFGTSSRPVRRSFIYAKCG